MPRWLVIGVLSVLLVGFLYICGNINEQKAIIRRELDRNGMERLIASQKIDEIDAQLAIACDETRIRSIAVNRLGMQLPSDEQLHGMAVPHVVKEAEWQQAQEGTKKSLFRLLLNTLGL